MQFRSRYSRGILALVVALALSACGDPLGSGDELLEEGRLVFVPVAADAPPLLATEVSFYAKKGETREVQLRYDPAYGYGNGKCLLLRVPAGALDRDASGRVFAAGDSVLIRVRVVDAGHFHFSFEPSGLRFDPANPAQLEVRHVWAAADLNGDGAVDSRDAAIDQRFGFWRQGRPGERWGRIQTTRDGQLLEARATLTTFSQYALASD